MSWTPSSGGTHSETVFSLREQAFEFFSSCPEHAGGSRRSSVLSCLSLPITRTEGGRSRLSSSIIVSRLEW